MAYVDSLDIANLTCQMLGVPRIADPEEDSVPNNEIAFAYDKERRAALRRNIWRFSIRYAALRPLAATTYLLDPAVWIATSTYPVGALVKDENGELWVSIVPDNYNNDPVLTSAWDRYFGPMTVSLFDDDVTYFAGELVYKTAGNPGSFVIFMSMKNENTAVPSTADAWVSTTTYQRGDTVSHSGDQWRSLIELNLNVTPAPAPLDWVEDFTFSTGQQVTAANGYIYTSVGNGNVAHDPVYDTAGTYWTDTGVPKGWMRVPDVYPSSLYWQPLYAGLSRIQLLSPLGVNRTNTYRLPSGYLLHAPQDPKPGLVALGGPSNSGYDDWLVEGDYIVTSEVSPFVLRFAADVVDVKKMDDLFCKGLACLIATTICEKVTQSNSKIATIASQYKLFMNEARLINAIEKGPRDAEEDDFVTCRR